VTFFDLFTGGQQFFPGEGYHVGGKEEMIPGAFPFTLIFSITEIWFKKGSIVKKKSDFSVDLE